MIEEKLVSLKEDLDKVVSELERLSQLRLKLMGAIEICEKMQEESKEDKKEEKSKK